MTSVHPKRRGPRDHKVVDVTTPDQLLAWSQYLGVAPQDVAKAVSVVGTDPEAVAEHLGR